jgi:prevent-host-death family protein
LTDNRQYHYFGEVMEKAISAAGANRKFSELLRSVRGGNSYVVTSHGKPVARIVPLQSDDRFMREARAALLKRLESEPVVRVGRFSRDELYEDRP